MKLGKRSIICVVLVAIVLALGCGYFLDPDDRLHGMMVGDPSFEGRYLSAWKRDLSDTDSNTRALALERLKNGGANAVPVLEAILKAAGPPEARWRAAEALGDIGVAARPAGPTLVAALEDPDTQVRTVALRATVKLAPDVPGAVPAFVKLFPDLDALWAVTEFGRKGGGVEAVPALIPLLTHTDPKVRWNAAKALGKIGPASKPAVPGLIAQLRDPEAVVREHAAEHLGDIGPEAASEAIPHLVNVLSDPNTLVRRDAVRALGKMGPAAKGDLVRVQAMLKDPEKEVRDAALDAERKIDPSLAGKQKKP